MYIPLQRATLLNTLRSCLPSAARDVGLRKPSPFIEEDQDKPVYLNGSNDSSNANAIPPNKAQCTKANKARQKC
eukprot:5805984-Pyramimonas_sp.AAC.3